MDFAAVLAQATQPGLPKTELLFDDPEGELDLGADVGLCFLDQILHPSIWGISKSPALTWPHGHPQFRCIASHLRSLGDFLV